MDKCVIALILIAFEKNYYLKDLSDLRLYFMNYLFKAIFDLVGFIII